ncbi:PepSY-like domain-containing protein [Dysgonomonas macrotermitis]|uniref:Putative beta-lactamase-inhibitor-like, PepSY-like n=1 Tax=Dysgonomonas macrotermitis TaxID=1346286 RepID=A0A1M5GNC4_9BACT|nr:PepSY-like domain-containing protein [Dysgonomonas macrotermitis]SHG05290.1 Putative beta-lactamase-inhibitor-like, PepSY-like [Dysgonomonas macrotermitis]
MKSLVTTLFLSSFILFSVGCSNDNNSDLIDGGTEVTGIQQSEIKLRIAEYYSAPSTSAQSVSNIQTEFDKKFPNATDVEWKASNNVYEIDFEISNVDYEAWYDSNANLLMYKYDIANGELPSAVSSAIASDYTGYTLDEAEKVYKGEIIGYYVDLKKNKTEVHAFYKEDGTFISKNLWEDDSVKPANDAETSTPEISGTLTDEATDALIAAYYSGNDTDILPANVPSAISSNFKTVFPNARDIDWETSANVYKVDFEINNVDYDAWYNSDGTLLAYRFDITKSSLPQSVQTAISDKFNGYTIEDVEKVIKANSAGYLVELENLNIEEDAYFTEDGTYISNSFYKASTSGDNTEEPVTTPEIPVDGNYTDDEIDALLASYQQGRDKDINAANVPVLVTTAFNSQFASARDIDWDYVGNVYKVDFEIANVDYEAWYVSDGTLLMYTQEVRYPTIASTVQNAVAAKYTEYKVDGCDYFQKGTIKGYIIELENKRTDAELIVIYKEDGAFISEITDY